MSLTRTKITCSCGASIESAFASELNGWQDRHDRCMGKKEENRTPFEIGMALYYDGHGLSHVINAVSCDDDIIHAVRGYEFAESEAKKAYGGSEK